MSWLSRRRIRTQLGLVLAGPLIAVLAFATVALAGSIRQFADADTAASWTALAQDAATLTYAVEVERAEAAPVVAGLVDPSSPAFRAAQTVTDMAVAEFRRQGLQIRGGAPEFAGLITRIGPAIASLPAVRAQVAAARGVTLSGIMLRYRLLIADLLAVRQVPALLGLPSELADQARASSALAQVAEQASLEHQAVFAVANDILTPAAAQRITAARTGLDETTREFMTLAPPEWRAGWEQTVTGAPVLDVQRFEGAVARTPVGTRLTLSTTDWSKAAMSQLALMRQVVLLVDADLLTSVRSHMQRQLQTAAVTAAAMLGVLILAVAVGYRVARSLSRRLDFLRTTAMVTAHKLLPEVVSSLRARDRGPITVDEVIAGTAFPAYAVGSDEIAEVGQAFGIAAKEAVRHAAGQAVTRQRATLMFVGLARRLQQLVDQMMARLDEVERDEQDPQRLDLLFGLDHVATRMGRYTDSLLVLAGTSSARMREEPVDIWDVLRAGAGQIERYERVHYGQIDSGVAVAAHAVDHIVHALAELLDNATAYSPPTWAVEVSAQRFGDRLMILIADRGIGIAPQALQELNERLRQPPQIELASVRSMGLAAVAAIASWHRLQVRLVAGADCGTVAEVVLPTGVLVQQPRHARPVPPPIPRLLERDREPALRMVSAGAAAPHTTWRLPDPRLPDGLVTAPPPEPAQDSGLEPLPVRVPQARLLPGAVPGQPAPPPRAVDPRRLAAQMRAYQTGLVQGRRSTPPTSLTS
jgi:signal transduction histidine kinase